MSTIIKLPEKFQGFVSPLGELYPLKKRERHEEAAKRIIDLLGADPIGFALKKDFLVRRMDFVKVGSATDPRVVVYNGKTIDDHPGLYEMICELPCNYRLIQDGLMPYS